MLWKRLKKEVIIYSIKVIFLSTLKKGQIFASPFRNCKGRSGKKSSFSAIREERKKILLKEEFFNATKERRGGRGGDRRWRSWEGGCSRQGEKAGEATPPLPPSELSNSQNKIGFHGEATPPSSSWGAIVHLQNSRYFEICKAIPFPKSLSWQLIIVWQKKSSLLGGGELSMRNELYDWGDWRRASLHIIITNEILQQKIFQI